MADLETRNNILTDNKAKVYLSGLDEAYGKITFIICKEHHRYIFRRLLYRYQNKQNNYRTKINLTVDTKFV